MNKLLILLPLLFIGCAEETVYQVDTTQLQIQIDAIKNELVLSQNEINSLQEQLTELATNENVVQLIDPCGDNEGRYDEIIMRTSQNRLIAFFQSGSQRYLTVLEPGHYITTDSQMCHFTVLDNGAIL